MKTSLNLFSRFKSSGAKSKYIICGLGNPGLDYARTYHNAGFCAVDLLAQQCGAVQGGYKFKAEFVKSTIEGEQVTLLKPQTYMNRSGESVREYMHYFKIPIERLIVVYDDIDLAMGRIRVRERGGAGTHNGMRSLIAQLQSEDFIRVRIGIGPAPKHYDLADYVLSKADGDAKESFDRGIQSAADAVGIIVTKGLQRAQEKYNKK